MSSDSAPDQSEQEIQPNPFQEFQKNPTEGSPQAQNRRSVDGSTILMDGPSPPGPSRDLSRPGRLHPLSIFFDVSSHIRSLIFPAVVGIFSAANGSRGGLIFAAIFFVMTLAQSMIRYFSLRYLIRDKELVVTEGIFFRRNRTVPVNRIQNIDLIQNVLHRIFRVAEVRIETASGTQAEATLRVLSLQRVEQLRQGIVNSTSKLQTTPTTSAPTPFADPAATLLQISPIQLLKAGLASNRGTILLGVLAGMYFQFNDQIEQQIDFGQIQKLVPEEASTIHLVLVTIAGVVAVLLLFRILGMAWYLLRFFGYELVRTEDDLRIRCGLLTKVSATVPRRRIQFISIHRNLLMRWMNLASIRIETAGGAGAANEDAAKTVSSRWFVPVVAEERVAEIITQLRPDLDWSEEAFAWQPISPLAPRRLTRIACFVSVAIAIAGGFAFPPWGCISGGVALPLLAGYALRSAAAKRYARNQFCVVYRSGLFTKKTSVTFFEKIQTVRIDETPFDRRWNMASLCVDTAAAGPADHRIHIHYLTRDFAEREYRAIVEQSSNCLPVFG